ncbi:MAG: PQQ-dependent sugar dehydrogenase [Opitutales bacterium]
MRIIALSLLAVAVRAPLPAEVALEPAFPKLFFSQPVAISPVPGDKQRLLVVEKNGTLQVVEGLGSAVQTKRKIFDITQPRDGKLEVGGECGFLGVALHPQYAKNSQVYVYYSLKIDGKLHQRVSSFRLSDASSLQVDPTTEQVLISQQDPAGNHNGGDLHFGPDGYLYISAGDGGGGGDPYDSARQIADRFLAAVFRIDVDRLDRNLAPNPHPAVGSLPDGKPAYHVPSDNPFVGARSHRGLEVDPAKVRTEIWATGLRNAWRFSFDPKTGVCYAGDVGQNLYEEIDILVPGGDYGWSVLEGDHVFNKKDAGGKKAMPSKGDHTASKFQAPIHEYDRKLGNSVTGGVVCRGDRVPGLEGAYVFGDFASGRIFALRKKGGAWQSEQIAKDLTVAGFGHDPSNGDVLVASLAGQVKRIVRK